MTDREERVRQRAHALWEAAGKPEGQDDHFWKIAEAEIDAEDAMPPPTSWAATAGPKVRVPAARGWE